MPMRTALSLLTFLILPGGLLAQESSMSCHAGYTGWVPQEILNRPLPIKSGAGTVHESVSTTSKDAQSYYDQGLAQLHSYFWIDATRSFQQALRLDPRLGMAWVRISQIDTAGFLDPAAARTALAKAEALRERMTEWEQTRLSLRKLQLDSIDDPKDTARLLTYRAALDQALAARYDDVELWLLRGNVEEPLGAWGIGQFGTAASVPFYEHALRLQPDHPAAHHYLIHSFEAIARIDDALAQGKIYASQAPAMPHARHMYGHDLRRVGRTREAIAEFLAADDLEIKYYRSENITPDLDWHHRHNLDLLAGSYQHEGEMKKAEERLRAVLAVAPVTESSAFTQKQWPAFLLSRGRTKECLIAAEQMTHSKWASERVMGYVLRGQALLNVDRQQEAQKQLALAEGELKGVSGPRAATIRRAATTYIDMLGQELLLSGPKRQEAVATLEAAEKNLRAPHGPDAWSQALIDMETIASIARQTGAWDLA